MVERLVSRLAVARRAQVELMIRPEDHVRLVHKIVGRMHPVQDAEYDDMVSDGMIGLLDACDRFDPSRGVQASTFLGRRVRGAILDGKRDRDRLPRVMRQRLNVVHSASRDLRARLQREPTRPEMIDELGIKEQKYDAALRAEAASNAGSLDSLFTPGGRALSEVVAEDDDYETLPAPIDVDALMACLDDRQRYVVTESYLFGRTLKEIASEYDITEARVSQIRKKALDTMRRTANGETVKPPGRGPPRKVRRRVQKHLAA